MAKTRQSVRLERNRRIQHIVEGVKKACFSSTDLREFVISRGKRCKHMASKYNELVLEYNIRYNTQEAK